ncbi:hypothetical protein [Streptomyces sp. NPDC001635]
MIVHDAATAFTAIVDAATAWVEALAAAGAFVLCVAAFLAGPLAAQAALTIRRRVAGPSWARSRRHARAIARRTRQLPLWAHTQPHDYDEAA